MITSKYYPVFTFFTVWEPQKKPPQLIKMTLLFVRIVKKVKITVINFKKRKEKFLKNQKKLPIFLKVNLTHYILHTAVFT